MTVQSWRSFHSHNSNARSVESLYKSEGDYVTFDGRSQNAVRLLLRSNNSDPYLTALAGVYCTYTCEENSHNINSMNGTFYLSGLIWLVYACKKISLYWCFCCGCNQWYFKRLVFVGVVISGILNFSSLLGLLSVEFQMYRVYRGKWYFEHVVFAEVVNSGILNVSLLLAW